MNKALFLDRDGTLVVDTHYLHKPEDLQPFSHTSKALRAGLDAGYLLFLFTNQSGIGRGYYTMEDALACNRHMVRMLGFDENPFLEICIAPETPEESPLYRKPSPKFIFEMREKHNLDPDNSWVVGDKLCDVEAGLNGGIRSAYVRTGKATDAEPMEFLTEHGIPAFENLAEFVGHL